MSHQAVCDVFADRKFECMHASVNTYSKCSCKVSHVQSRVCCMRWMKPSLLSRKLTAQATGLLLPGSTCTSAWRALERCRTCASLLRLHGLDHLQSSECMLDRLPTDQKNVKTSTWPSRPMYQTIVDSLSPSPALSKVVPVVELVSICTPFAGSLTLSLSAFPQQPEAEMIF